MLWLQLHQGIGYIVVLGAVIALFDRRARRIELFILLAQVLIGIALWAMLRHGPPLLHWLLALIAGGIYAMANAFERRGRPPGQVRALLVLALVIVAIVFYLGMSAVKAGI
jgi:hypothetical protein